MQPGLFLGLYAPVLDSGQERWSRHYRPLAEPHFHLDRHCHPAILCDQFATLFEYALRYSWQVEICPFPATNPAHAQTRSCTVNCLCICAAPDGRHQEFRWTPRQFRKPDYQADIRRLVPRVLRTARTCTQWACQPTKLISH